jgi:hypothetical protein
MKGIAMLREHSEVMDKSQIDSKVNFQQYLSNSDEPSDNISSDTPMEFETELHGDSYFMRRKFRHIAQGIRNY